MVPFAHPGLELFRDGYREHKYCRNPHPTVFSDGFGFIDCLMTSRKNAMFQFENFIEDFSDFLFDSNLKFIYMVEKPPHSKWIISSKFRVTYVNE